MAEADQALYQAVSDVLLYDWDPVGVSDIPEAHDEYYDYLPAVYKLVEAGERAEVLGDYLQRIERKMMDIYMPRERLSAVAAKPAALRRLYPSTH